MILVRSPLRVSIGGGGTDLPSYYEKEGGFVISAAIDKYVYAAINRPFSEGYILKYSQYENVKSLNEIRHPIIREALRILRPFENRIEISTMADIPSGTGLGSSGSFTTALLMALSAYLNEPIHTEELAQLACKIEIDILGEPIGKQDQYIAAYGGFTSFEFLKNGEVLNKSMNLASDTIRDLEDNLLLFYTGIARSAGSILKDQDLKTHLSDRSMMENLNFIKNLGLRCLDLLKIGDTAGFGDLMNEHWQYKRSRSQSITNELIDNAYKSALKNGAIGGKLVGAGGGGFLMFYAKDPEKLRSCMSEFEMDEVTFKFDFHGTSLVIP